MCGEINLDAIATATCNGISKKLVSVFNNLSLTKLFPVNYLPYLFEKNAVVVEFI